MNKQYPDEVVKETLSPQVFLLAVENTLNLSKSEGGPKDMVVSRFLCHLLPLCYFQGMFSAVDAVAAAKKENARIDDPEAMADKILDVGYSRYLYAVNYCKDVEDVDLAPMGFIEFVHKLVESFDNPSVLEVAIGHAIDRLDKHVRESAKKDIESAMGNTSDDVEPIEMPDFDTSDPEVLKEFFTLFQELGTIYNSRDKYETEEEKKKYDRFVVLYNTILGEQQ